MLDRKQLIGEVAARHGIMLEQDDPAFLLVTLAELTLKEAHAEFIAATQRAVAEYEESAKRLQEGAGAAIAVAMKHQLRTRADAPIEKVGQNNPSSNGNLNRDSFHSLVLVALGVLAGLLLFWSGFAFGRAN